MNSVKVLIIWFSLNSLITSSDFQFQQRFTGRSIISWLFSPLSPPPLHHFPIETCNKHVQSHVHLTLFTVISSTSPQISQYTPPSYHVISALAIAIMWLPPRRRSPNYATTSTSTAAGSDTTRSWSTTRHVQSLHLSGQAPDHVVVSPARRKEPRGSPHNFLDETRLDEEEEVEDGQFVKWSPAWLQWPLMLIIRFVLAAPGDVVLVDMKMISTLDEEERRLFGLIATGLTWSFVCLFDSVGKHRLKSVKYLCCQAEFRRLIEIPFANILSYK